MGNPPVCPICGESVADYKGPCPKPSPPTMAEQSAEVVMGRDDDKKQLARWGKWIADNGPALEKAEEMRKEPLTPSPPTMAEQSAEVVEQRIARIEAKLKSLRPNALYLVDGPDGKWLIETVKRLGGELRAALAREAAANKRRQNSDLAILGWVKQHREAEARATAAEACCAELGKALQPWLEHGEDCPGSWKMNSCTCGLDAALAAKEGK